MTQNRPPIPPTLWAVFCARFVPESVAPATAAELADLGYLRRVEQGKISGYAIAWPTYRIIASLYETTRE